MPEIPFDALTQLLQKARENEDEAERRQLLGKLLHELQTRLQPEVPDARDAHLELAVASLWKVLKATSPPQTPPEELQGSRSFNELYQALLELRNFALALANGDLSRQLPMKGYAAGALKTLQAHLNHLTWQTQMVACGDFSQRVDFMGDFSKAFNSMVQQLSATLQDLQDKEQALIHANTELQQEVAQRRKTEEQLRRSEERYRRLADTDPLTGLCNRRRFFSLALAELQRSCRYGHNMTLVMLDVDHFKQVNDIHGHAVGDMVLQAVAARAREALRNVDIVARYGGEEFVVLLPETDQKGGLQLAERLRCELADASLPIATGNVLVTASFGVCSYAPQPHSSATPTLLEQLVTAADQALYKAKHLGRNRVESCIFEPEEQ